MSGPLTEVALLLLNTFVNLYVLIVLLRFLLQVVKADFYNPVSQFIVKATNPVLVPIRRIVPGVGGIDLSSLILAWTVEFIGMGLVYALVYGGQIPPILNLCGWAIIALIQTLLNIYMFSILIIVILSWIAPQSYNPAVLLLHQLTGPMLSRIRKIMPDMGMLDLSPIVAFLLIQVIEIFLRPIAEAIDFPSKLTQLALGL
ncbi:YggT family protein [Litoribrevibacter euphylliae]|uniref:YggT family protein n=1 Tax=Litoribrevibacter euphylliae TaxID=1834034 RepID=A0ABV7HGZ1_9GAMM